MALTLEPIEEEERKAQDDYNAVSNKDIHQIFYVLGQHIIMQRMATGLPTDTEFQKRMRRAFLKVGAELLTEEPQPVSA